MHWIIVKCKHCLILNKTYIYIYIYTHVCINMVCMYKHMGSWYGISRDRHTFTCVCVIVRLALTNVHPLVANYNCLCERIT